MIPKYVLVCGSPIVSGASLNGATPGACPSGWLSVSVYRLVMQPNTYYLPVCDSAFTASATTSGGCPGNVRGVTVADAMASYSDPDFSQVGIVVAATVSVLSVAWIIRRLQSLLN